MKKYLSLILVVISSFSSISTAFAFNSKDEPLKIFQQYKQETVYPVNNYNNNSIYNYNMYFSQMPRHGYNRGYRYMPPMFYYPFYNINNFNLDDNAEYYLKHMPKDTYVDENEYNIFNKKSEN